MLSILGWLYEKAAGLRNLLYDRGVFGSRQLGIPAISIGNLTVGGVGKTPIAAFAARCLFESGETVCVISRGYKRDEKNSLTPVSDGKTILTDVRRAGDEPYELALQLLGTACVVCDADRINAARFARAEFGATAVVLDDAFQHRKVARDLDILVLDGLDPFGGGRVVPAGRLREPRENARRADIIVLTRTDLMEEAEGVANQIRRLNPAAPLFLCRNEISRITPLAAFPGANREQAGDGANIQHLRSRSAVAFCGLGNPENFFLQLRRAGFDPVREKRFPDHHRYDDADVQLLNGIAESSGAEIFLTTAKDAVKLAGRKFVRECCVVENDLVFDDEAGFATKIREALARILHEGSGSAGNYDKES